MSLYKSFFIFCSGLVLGVFLFAGKGKDSHTVEQNLNALENSRHNRHYQETPRAQVKAPELKLNTQTVSQHKAFKVPKNAPQKYDYNPDGVYTNEQSRDQTPTAPPGSYQTATQVPTIGQDEETSEELTPSEESVTYSLVEQQRIKELEQELKDRDARMENLRKKSNDNSASFASVGMYHQWKEELKNEESENGSGNYGGGSFGNGGSGGKEVGGQDVLPAMFTVAGVNTANKLLNNDSITIHEFVDYMGMGLEDKNLSLQRLAVSALSARTRPEAFSLLAQFSASTTDALNQHLDSELNKHMKNQNGLKFLSRQIAQSDSTLTSQLAIHTVSVILESDVPPELFDVLISDVLRSLNSLPPSHPGYNQGRQLSALIPTIVNS